MDRHDEDGCGGTATGPGLPRLQSLLGVVLKADPRPFAVAASYLRPGLGPPGSDRRLALSAFGATVEGTRGVKPIRCSSSEVPCSLHTLFAGILAEVTEADRPAALTNFAVAESI